MPKIVKAERKLPTGKPGLSWEQQEVSIHVHADHGKGSLADIRRISAAVLGTLAVHASANDKPRKEETWVLSHLLTHRVLWRGREMDGAVAIAEVLQRDCPEPWLLDDPGETIRACPLWVEPWLCQCVAKGECVPVECFQENFSGGGK